MAQDNATVYLLVIVAVIAVLGLGLSATSFATDQSMSRMMGSGGNEMMGSPGTATGPGAFEWAVLILSAAFFVLAVVLLIRNREMPARSNRPATGSTPAVAPTAPVLGYEPTTQLTARTESPSQQGPPIGEPTLVRLLGEDERRMYLELRDHGGQMLQRDLVALGTFSKAKVTRILDKLEAKGIVVREAHGMTNRVRLVPQPPK